MRFENTYTGELAQDFVYTCAWIFAASSIGSDDINYYFFLLLPFDSFIVI